MTPIDLLIPPPHDFYAAEAIRHAQPYVTAFAEAGLTVTLRDWTGPGVGDAPALALFVWGYHVQAQRWRALLESWPGDVPLLNPPTLMRWNTHKTYLSELEAAGVPTVPTWFGDADPETIAAAFDRFGTDELVIKPQISAGSHHTYRIPRNSPFPKLPAAMIQPFLPSIQSEGEYSLFYIGGVLSHAIRKTATGGDFRIQPQFGGRNVIWSPDPEATVVAEAALHAAPAGALYARVDLLRRLDGRLALIEFEAIEPDLYPGLGAGIPDRLVGAVVAAL